MDYISVIIPQEIQICENQNIIEYFSLIVAEIIFSGNLIILSCIYYFFLEICSFSFCKKNQ